MLQISGVHGGVLGVAYIKKMGHEVRGLKEEGSTSPNGLSEVLDLAM
jgi:hypothetical protein